MSDLVICTTHCDSEISYFFCLLNTTRSSEVGHCQHAHAIPCNVHVRRQLYRVCTPLQCADCPQVHVRVNIPQYSQREFVKQRELVEKLRELSQKREVPKGPLNNGVLDFEETTPSRLCRVHFLVVLKLHLC